MMGMVQKLITPFSLLFIFIVSCGNAEYINEAEELIQMFAPVPGKTNVNKEIWLHNDIDFSGSNLQFPLGATSTTCDVSFTGTIHGNKHVITGLRILDSTYAGLFCKLENATIENLVIDDCEFNGKIAGALSATVELSLVVRNIINNATVNGEQEASGFIGTVEQLQQSSISFEGCINSGGVKSTQGKAGGFIGFVSQCVDTNITISNSTNNGTVIGFHSAGGFIGNLEENSNQKVLISDSINSGEVSGTTDDYQERVIGGIVGVISSPSNKGSIDLIVINSENNGDVSDSKQSCGLLCIDDVADIEKVNITILNSINKGNFKQTKAYGITNTVTKARNVVSMGKVIDTSQFETF